MLQERDGQSKEKSQDRSKDSIRPIAIELEGNVFGGYAPYFIQTSACLKWF
jgi:hypothetical protein